jgi:CheY-like chemotaxis protein
VFTFRAMVASADEGLRRAAAEAAENVGCEVVCADGDCLGGVRAARPDLLILVPPLPCGSVTTVLDTLRQEPAGRVPVLVLSGPVRGGPFPRVPRLFLNGRRDAADALPRLVDRLHARLLGGCSPSGYRSVFRAAEL